MQLEFKSKKVETVWIYLYFGYRAFVRYYLPIILFVWLCSRAFDASMMWHIAFIVGLGLQLLDNFIFKKDKRKQTYGL